MPGSVHDPHHPLDQLSQRFDRFEKASELESDLPSDPNNSEYSQPDVSVPEQAPPCLTPKQERFPKSSFRPEPSSGRTRRLATQRAEIEQRLEQLNLLNDPVQKVFFILAARLNNASTLQAELLPEEYSRLSNSVINRFITIVEMCGGIFEQQAGSGWVAYFLPENQSDSPMPVIDCALEIKSQMNDISREWKIRKGWLHDIELNMAMHRADEFIALLPTQLGSALLSHGNALSECSRMCELISAGQIWSTKDLVNQLDREEIKRLNFGIYRRDNHRQVLVGKSFSRLADLADLDLNPVRDDFHIGELAATQIFNCQSR
jgi:class 3 adenylate cyclase